MQRPSRWSTILAPILFALGCGPKAGNETDETSSDGGEGQDDVSTAVITDGDPESGEPFLVDCSLLPADGPTVGPGLPGPTGFPEGYCNPRQEELGSGPYRCCSDDPAAVGGKLPDYALAAGDVELGEPIFAGPRNDLGASGMCVNTSEIAAELALPEAGNCPIPCNPTWTPLEVQVVCGANRACCQTRELQPNDCIADESGARPATGADIFDGLTNWSATAHETHQDPNGVGCQQFVGCSGESCTDNDAYRDCLLQLSVADQRGFCMLLPAGGTCPAADPNYIDACEAM